MPLDESKASAEEHAAEPWAERIPQLREEITKLTRLIGDQAAEEKDAQEQIQSLTYAADLTRGEVERRARSNSEMSTVYQRESANGEEGHTLEGLHRLEEELLSAKRDAANITFEVEQMDFKLKKLREKAVAARPGMKGVMHGDVRSPASPALRSSPQLTSLAGGNLAKRKISPATRPSRLIGDVDCLVGFVDDKKEGLGSEEYAPCRLGVTASGHVALYSYASAVPQLELDERNASAGELEGDDMETLRKNMDSVDLQIAGSMYELCGLRESVGASMQLIQDASKLLRADDEEIASTG